MSSMRGDPVQFMKADKFAVVGASTDPTKFGNRILKWYIAHSIPVTPINPSTPTIESLKTHKSLSSLPTPSKYSVSVITPPKITLTVMKEAADLGIKNVWLQPGAESDEAIQEGEKRGVNVVVGGGACVLVHGEEAMRRAKL